MIVWLMRNSLDRFHNRITNNNNKFSHSETDISAVFFRQKQNETRSMSSRNLFSLFQIFFFFVFLLLLRLLYHAFFTPTREREVINDAATFLVKITSLEHCFLAEHFGNIAGTSMHSWIWIWIERNFFFFGNFRKPKKKFIQISDVIG